MSLIAIINIIIINALVLVALSYYWSFWTHRLFKPWQWQERRRSKLLSRPVESAERGMKDRVRFYTVWFVLRDLERREVRGDILVVGVEQTGLLSLCHSEAPTRRVTAVGPMVPSQVTLRHENCQGEVSEETVNIDYAPLDDCRRVLGPDDVLIQGAVGEHRDLQTGPLALLLIDTVEYDDVLAFLRLGYQALQSEGVIIVHGYNHTWPGIRQAVDEFEASVHERFVPVADQYGSVMLVRNK